MVAPITNSTRDKLSAGQLLVVIQKESQKGKSMNRKLLLVMLAAVGAALMFCNVSEARGRLFGRRAGGGGGGGYQAINPNSLPAGYAPQATAIQQGACVGPNCPNPIITNPVAGYAIQQTGGVAVSAPGVTVATSAARVSSVDTAGRLGSVERLEGLRAEVAKLEATVAQERAAAVANVQVSGAVDFTQMGKEIGAGIASSLGIKVQGEPHEKGSLADVVDQSPSFTGTLKDAEGKVIDERTIKFADVIRDDMGSK